PDMGTWNYAYDDKNRLISQTDAKNQTILLSYDALDRLVQKSTPAGQSLAYFSYDTSTNGIGRRATMCVDVCSSGWGSGTKYQYDVMGRIVDERPYTNKSMAMNPTVARTYDGAGRVLDMTYPDGEVVTYSYDTAGRLSGAVSSAFTSQNIVSSATYNARGNLATRTLGNGVVETFTYDPDRFWLTGVSASLNSTLIHSVSLTRNKRGEVTSRSNTLESNDNWSYVYDDLRRMTTATNTNNAFWSESFTFDETNRITSSSRLGTYSYAAAGSGQPANAPQNIGGATLQYDANGNMTSDGVTTLVFDVENRPVNVGGIASTYNPEGERTSVGTVYFTKDLRESDSATGISTQYYFFGESRVASSSQGQLTFYHGDHLNSASTMTDTNGAVIGRQVLSPYGRKLATGGYTGPIGLAGQRLDITGLYHMGAREMNPSLGIFVTADPSGAPDPEKPQTLSRYAYANNSPTNLVDPTGYVAESPADTVMRVGQNLVNKAKAYVIKKTTEAVVRVVNGTIERGKAATQKFFSHNTFALSLGLGGTIARPKVPGPQNAVPTGAVGGSVSITLTHRWDISVTASFVPMAGHGGGAAGGISLSPSFTEGGATPRGGLITTNHHIEASIPGAGESLSGAYDFSKEGGAYSRGIVPRASVGELAFVGIGEQINATYTFTGPKKAQKEDERK
ncbi:MAG: RHS repeat-associated core domain-containing protein, partial [Arenimonas sp.]